MLARGLAPHGLGGHHGRMTATVTVTGRLSLVLVWAALVVGTVHAGFSAYWAVGGTWLLPSVGGWTETTIASDRAGATVVLALTSAAKLAAAVVPVAVAYGRMPYAKLWRGISWVGGIGIILYGAINIATGLLVLGGIIRPDGGYNSAAIIGHTAIWGPLWLLWGACLVGSLATSRR